MPIFLSGMERRPDGGRTGDVAACEGAGADGHNRDLPRALKDRGLIPRPQVIPFAPLCICLCKGIDRGAFPDLLHRPPHSEDTREGDWSRILGGEDNRFIEEGRDSGDCRLKYINLYYDKVLQKLCENLKFNLNQKAHIRRMI